MNDDSKVEQILDCYWYNNTKVDKESTNYVEFQASGKLLVAKIDNNFAQDIAYRHSLDPTIVIAQPPRGSSLDAFDGKALVDVSDSNFSLNLENVNNTFSQEIIPIYSKAKQIGSKLVKMAFPITAGLNKTSN